jgi:methionyl-tRNA formyltransferase
MHPVEEHSLADCGAIRAEADTLCASCGSFTTLSIDEVQPEGKRRMSAAEFLRGYQFNSGERLGD